MINQSHEIKRATKSTAQDSPEEVGHSTDFIESLDNGPRLRDREILYILLQFAPTVVFASNWLKSEVNKVKDFFDLVIKTKS